MSGPPAPPGHRTADPAEAPTGRGRGASELSARAVPAPARILVLRLDRLGDVVLSTPVFEELRRRFPHAFIAAMVRPACRDVVAGHPDVNEVILYDKEGAHRGVWATIRFARGLRRSEFDTALILHPSNRSHWISWLARIPVRLGYDRKCPWLLTHRLPHRKQEGARHEAAYTLELLQPFGIHPGPPRPLVPVAPKAAERVAALLERAGIGPSDPVVAIHPSASCVSKRWMPERFAQVADQLIAEHGVRVCVVAGGTDVVWAHQMAAAMHQPVLDVSGRLPLGELNALLGRCQLLISNDSGPVHLAAALGVPVVDIFSRNQPGLSPQRWRPLGQDHLVLHKDVGCVTCLAHNCDIGFLCLTSLTVQEVYDAAVTVLQRTPPQSVES